MFCFGGFEQVALSWPGIGKCVRAQSRALGSGRPQWSGWDVGKERELHQSLMCSEGPLPQNAAFLILTIIRQNCVFSTSKEKPVSVSLTYRDPQSDRSPTWRFGDRVTQLLRKSISLTITNQCSPAFINMYRWSRPTRHLRETRLERRWLSWTNKTADRGRNR